MARQLDPLTIETQTHGAVPRSAIDYARDKIAAKLRLAPEPVLFARIKLSVHGNPAVNRRAVAQVNVDVNGRLVRVQTATETMQEAVDETAEQLRMRFERIARHWEARRGGRPTTAPNEWRHQSTPAPRPTYFPRPLEERKVVRRKTYAAVPTTIEEAIWDLDLLDYDFYLFTDADTGEDSLVERAEGGYPVTRRGSAPRLRLTDAIERLEATGSPYVFFVESDTGRASVVYHRYDGHYGLIAPAM